MFETQQAMYGFHPTLHFLNLYILSLFTILSFVDNFVFTFVTLKSSILKRSKYNYSGKQTRFTVLLLSSSYCIFCCYLIYKLDYKCRNIAQTYVLLKQIFAFVLQLLYNRIHSVAELLVNLSILNLSMILY